MHKASALALGALLTAAPALAQDRVVNVYDRGGRIPVEALEAFTAETGIGVDRDIVASSDPLASGLPAGTSGYDVVVVPSGSFLERQFEAGLVQPREGAKPPDPVNMDAPPTAAQDPGTAYTVDYMWGTTGLGYNVAEVTERLGADADLDSWDLLFDPETVGRLADCGVAMLDAPAVVYAAARNYLGLDPNSEREADLAAAEALLMSVRPYIRHFHSSRSVDELASGEICLAQGYSADLARARTAAEEAGRGIEIAHIIPAEGALKRFVRLAIPAGAPNADNAHAFIAFVLRLDIAAAGTGQVHGAAERLYTLEAHGPQYEAALMRSFARVQAGL